jgi:riboflavin synthase
VFTGIVESVATVTAVEQLGNGRQFTISAGELLSSLALGDSIAVDGACQTVVELLPDAFRVQAIATTLGRTVMGGYLAGTLVNLERPVAIGERLGGHLVQGHVDGVGTITRVERQDELVVVECEMPQIVAEVTILHGSVTVNGVSLTVNALPRTGEMQVAIIPYTLKHTTLGRLRSGDRVNLEGDMIGKYVRHLLASPGARADRADVESEDLLPPSGYSTKVYDEF